MSALVINRDRRYSGGEAANKPGQGACPTCPPATATAVATAAAARTLVGLRDLPVDRIVDSTGATANRLSLREILFPAHGLAAYRALEGEEMTPIAVVKSGSRYIAANGDGRLAVARALGRAFVLAEVWE